MTAAAAARVAVLAGGRGSRLGGAKATVLLGGEPLLSWVLRAAAEFDPVVVAKRSTVLPALSVPIWIEPDEPSHPLCGLVAALERSGGPVVAVACDQPWVSPELLRRLAAARPALCSVAGQDEPFPGRYDPSQLDILRAALAGEASLRSTLRKLVAARIEVAPGEIASVNTPGELAGAEARLRADAAPHVAPPRTGPDATAGAQAAAGRAAFPHPAPPHAAPDRAAPPHAAPDAAAPPAAPDRAAPPDAAAPPHAAPDRAAPPHRPTRRPA